VYIATGKIFLKKLRVAQEELSTIYFIIKTIFLIIHESFHTNASKAVKNYSIYLKTIMR